MGEIRNKVRERKRQERLQERKDRLVSNFENMTSNPEDFSMSELRFLNRVLNNLDDYRTLDKFLSSNI